MLGLILPMVLLMTGPDEPQAEALVLRNSHFVLDLHQRLGDRPGNLFVSPYSISTALTMTYAGARGETADQMAKTLHFPPTPDRLHEVFAAMKVSGGVSQFAAADRLWGQRGFHFLPDFLSTTRDTYGVELAEVEFARTEEARRQIYEWVEEQTHGKIEDLIQQGVLDRLTRLVLTNTVDLAIP